MKRVRGWTGSVALEVRYRPLGSHLNRLGTLWVVALWLTGASPVGYAQDEPQTPRKKEFATLAGTIAYLGSNDLRILATTVKFGSTTLAISYSIACPMNID